MMPFPHTPRVVYRRSPLSQVSCTWTLAAPLDAAAVDAIKLRPGIFTEPPKPDPVASMPELAELPAIKVAYPSRDEAWSFSVHEGLDAFSLTTTAYSMWEVFAFELQALLEEVARVGGHQLQRVTLRHLNAVAPYVLDKLEEGQRRWTALFHPALVGLWADDAVAAALTDAQGRLCVDLGAGDTLCLTHWEQRLDEGRVYVLSYVCEHSFVEGGASIEAAARALRRLNGAARRAFRWSITETLHDAMEPLDVPALEEG